MAMNITKSSSFANWLTCLDMYLKQHLVATALKFPTAYKQENLSWMDLSFSWMDLSLSWMDPSDN